MLGACGEGEVSSAPARKGDAALGHGSGGMELAGTCQAKRSAKRRCQKARTTPVWRGGGGQSSIRAQTPLLGEAAAGQPMQDLPTPRIMSCRDPEEVSGCPNPVHTHALGCSPCHGHVRARARVCTGYGCGPLCPPVSLPVCACPMHAGGEHGSTAVSRALPAAPEHRRTLAERSAKHKHLGHIWLPSEGLRNISGRARERKGSKSCWSVPVHPSTSRRVQALPRAKSPHCLLPALLQFQEREKQGSKGKAVQWDEGEEGRSSEGLQGAVCFQPRCSPP